jgi:hypothetical protein
MENLSQEETEKIINKIVEYVRSKKIEGLVIFFLESIKPLSFIGGELISYYLPIFLPPTSNANLVIKVLQKRENLEIIIEKLKNKEGGAKGEAPKLSE